jgi:hypothetical protein
LLTFLTGCPILCSFIAKGGLPFAVACSFVCHSAAFCLSFRSAAEESAVAFASALAVAVACSFVCHSAAQRRNLLFAFASALAVAVACSFVCHSTAQRRNLLFALAVAVACLFSISSQKTRHLDRSNGQSHRLLRSGEIRFCVCLRPRF